MSIIDWVVVVLFMSTVVGTGLWFTRRASKSMADFFVADRKIPWWLAGTSMLATSFASDTPLHTTRAIREGGLAAAWFYWNGIIGGLIVAFVFSRLWRRTGVVTDNELIELRYTGKRAAVLRGGLALFKSLALEILTMAWITLGMVKIVKTILELPDFTAVPLIGPIQTEVLVVAALIVVTIAFSVASGFWGVVATDIAEFSVAMTGAIVLAFVAVDKVGGTQALVDGVAKASPLGAGALDWTPQIGGEGIGVLAFGVYIGVMWWANSQVDGSGQRAQRFLACKDERHAIAAGIWNMAVQWIIRSWPWYVAALASIILYPNLTDSETAYPRMVADLMPIGLKGLMVASFFAAFMGTMEAHYNLCASYAVNDVYKRFLAPGKTDHHYVKASRWMTLGVALVAGVAALLLPSVLGAFRFKMELVAGLGLIYILRWFWWRVSATTEITALLTSVVTALVVNWLPATSGGGANGSAFRLLLVVGVSASAALIATYIAGPEPREHLLAFFRRVRPPKFLWGPIATMDPSIETSGMSWRTPLQILLAIVFVYGLMLGIGRVVLGDLGAGLALMGVGSAAGVATIRWVFYSK